MATEPHPNFLHAYLAGQFDPPTDDVEERCVFCGELRSPDQFEDGLRCRICAEDQDAEDSRP